MHSDDYEGITWTDVLISSLRHIAQVHGDDPLEVKVGDGDPEAQLAVDVGLRTFLSDYVVLTYSYPRFVGGHGYVENLLFTCPQWRAEASIWFEYCRHSDPVETACQFNIDGDSGAFELWLGRMLRELCPTE